MFETVLKYFHTIRHLKFIQIRYQLFYIIRRKLGWKPRLKHSVFKVKTARLLLTPFPKAFRSHLGNNCFEFLNIQHDFGEKIDWNEAQYGKLWTYNLTYFEFLLQPEMTPETGLKLMRDFIAAKEHLNDALEPFPISLRIINWIKFLSHFEMEEETIKAMLWQQTQLLTQQLEYHLMGNHLLENAFALLFAGYYFGEKKWEKQGQQLLLEQLEEQILADGAHFELTPMYHQLMLGRVLDGYNLVWNNRTASGGEFAFFLKEKASKMLGWMEEMRLQNGTIPHFNDSTNGVAPKCESLLKYAENLGIKPIKIDLSESGYRKITTENYDLLVDVGKIGPSYIPGHAHSDTFNFALHHRGQPLLVDTGISTYEKNQQRQQERSTAAHNTVQIGGEEQSEIWGGFRVARRAKIVQLEEGKRFIRAVHDGYQRQGYWHERKWEWSNEKLVIQDDVKTAQNAKAYLHFHPTQNVKIEDHKLVGKMGTIYFSNAKEIKLTTFAHARGYNSRQESQLAIIHFDYTLTTTFSLL